MRKITLKDCIVTLKAKHTKPIIVRQVGGYFQDPTGAWWLLNPQSGWAQVPNDSRALQFALRETGFQSAHLERKG